MSESIELQVNLNTLIQAGWRIEMETGLRGGEIRSWVKLRHWEKGKSHKVRAVPTDLKSAVAMVMLEAGLQPYRHALGESASTKPDALSAGPACEHGYYRFCPTCHPQSACSSQGE
jgi:hypothetical protein